MRSASFNLRVGLDCICSVIDGDGLTKHHSADATFAKSRLTDANSTFFVLAKNLKIFLDYSSFGSAVGVAENPSLLGVFVLPSMIAPLISAIDWDKKGRMNHSHQSEEFDSNSICREKDYDNNFEKDQSKKNRHHCGCSCCFCLKLSTDDSAEISFERILPQIHASLSGLSIHGFICSSKHLRPTEKGLAGDMIILDIPSEPERKLIMDQIQGECMLSAPHIVIKALPISTISCTSQFGTEKYDAEVKYNDEENQSHQQGLVTSSCQKILHEIPSCPVCLHRIDTQRLGFPKPKNDQLCSQFCSATGCTKMKFLCPWPFPAHCEACSIIWNRWKLAGTSSDSAAVQNQSTILPQSTHSSGNIFSSVSSPSSQLSSDLTSTTNFATSPQHCGDDKDFVCYKCKMKETLWVCLICGVIGCGRYSQGHAREHFWETGHPYSLELVTQRIWDYDTGEYAQRGDILICASFTPSASPNDALGPSLKNSYNLHDHSFEYLDASGNSAGNSTNPHCLHYADPSPKKTSMISEEYEALLQSALEDQAQHYEFEITRLVAELTANGVEEEKISEQETSEIESLQRQLSGLHLEADCLSRELLEAQAQEAGYRATYQRLLREQAVAKDLLDKIKGDSKREQEEGKSQVADLEQQIVDLTANLQMREQIAKDDELSNAQIFGTSYTPTKPRKGKKSRRSLRK